MTSLLTSARLRLVTATVGLCVLAVAALGVQGARSAPSRPLLGIMDDALLQYRMPLALASLRALHPGILRYDVDWPQIAARRPASPRDPGDPAYRFATTDAVVSNAARLGIPVLLTIVHTPPWAGGGAGHNHAPRRLADLRDFAYAVATRYSGSYTPRGAGAALPQVSRWEAWNEPNTNTHLTPQFSCRNCGARAVPRSPAIYAGLLSAIYTGVHSAGARAGVPETVAGGATRPGGSGPDSFEPSIAPLRFLDLLARLHPKLDVWSHHPYRIPGLTAASGAGATIQFQDLPRLLRELDRVMPGRHLHVWVTEYALQTRPPDRYTGVPLAAQAAALSRNYALARRLGRVDMIVWFLINDEALHGARDSGFQSGLAFVNGRHKPAWNTFVKLAR